MICVPNMPNHEYLYTRVRESISRRIEKMKEKEVEEYLRDKVKAIGGIAYKFVSPGNVGVPDRVVVLPGGAVLFVELKSPTGKPTAMQQKQINKLSVLGADVRVVKSKQEVDAFILHCRSVIANDF